MKHFCVILACLALSLAARADVVSGVSVVVNDQVITYGEIADKVSPLLANTADIYGNDRTRFETEASRVRADQIESLVQRKLVLHEFTSAGYVTNVLESFIDDMVKKNIQNNFGGDRARLIKTLQAQGRTLEMYRREVREDFIVNYMNYHNVDEPRKILISPLKIDQYYREHQVNFKVEDQVKLRMIVITAPPDSTARKMADEVLGKIDAGVSFAEMAGINSSGSHKADGGEYGWILRKDLKPELADVAFSLKAGQHSGVIELPEACYILLAEEVRPAHVQTLEETRAEIERTLKSQEKSTLRHRWIDRLKTKSFIQYY